MTEETFQDKPAVYYEGEDMVVRASALGNCLGNLIRSGVGQTPEPPPEFMLGRFRQGHELEEFGVKYAKGIEGCRVMDDWEMEEHWVCHPDPATGDLQPTYEVPCKGGLIRGHADFGVWFTHDEAGTPLDSPVPGLGEVKHLGEGMAYTLANKGVSHFRPYSYQLSGEMIGGEASDMTRPEGDQVGWLPVLYVIGVKPESKAEDVIDPTDVTYSHKVYADPPMTVGQLKLRFLQVKAGIEGGELPDCDYAQFPCGFYRDHDGQKVWEKDGALDASDLGIDTEILDAFAGTRDRGVQLENEGKEQKKKAAQAITELLDRHGQKGITVHGKNWEVKDIVQGKTGRLDVKKLCEGEGLDLADMKAKYTGEGYEVRYPKVKKIEGDK